MLKLSIITINYNNLLGLQKTMQSVFDQSFTDYEYIIIDGGSTDGSEKYIEKYSNKLKYWISEKDQGIYDAINKGILKACGEYCVFLNSGDYFLKDSILTECYSIIEKKYADIYYGNIIIERVSGLYESKKHAAVINLDVLERETINHQASFIKHSLFNDLGTYDLNFSMAADYVFYLKAYLNGKIFLHIPSDLVYYQLNGLSEKNWSEYARQMHRGFEESVTGPIKELWMQNREYRYLMQGRLIKFALQVNKIIKSFKK